MEGGKEGNYPSGYRSIPPLTAVDRFLWGRSHLPQQQQTQSSFKSKESGVSSNGLGDFSCSNSAITEFQWPCSQEINLVDGLFSDAENFNCYRNPNMGFLEEEEIKVSGKSGTGKKAKKAGGPCLNLIKGQWTEDEDR